MKNHRLLGFALLVSGFSASSRDAFAGEFDQTMGTSAMLDYLCGLGASISIMGALGLLAFTHAFFPRPGTKMTYRAAVGAGCACVATAAITYEFWPAITGFLQSNGLLKGYAQPALPLGPGAYILFFFAASVLFGIPLTLKAELKSGSPASFAVGWSASFLLVGIFLGWNYFHSMDTTISFIAYLVLLIMYWNHALFIGNDLELFRDKDLDEPI